jgi:hypothetical protein
MIAFIGFGVIEILLFLVMVPFVIAVFAFWIWMLVHAITNPGLRDVEKLIWVVVILFTHFIGALIYFFVGRPRRSQPITSY